MEILTVCCWALAKFIFVEATSAAAATTTAENDLTEAFMGMNRELRDGEEEEEKKERTD